MDDFSVTAPSSAKLPSLDQMDLDNFDDENSYIIPLLSRWGDRRVPRDSLSELLTRI